MTTPSPSATLGPGEVGELASDAPAPSAIPIAPPAPTDEALLASFIKGDRQSLGLLAERYEAHLLGLASSLLRGRRDLAMDAVQETWLRVIKYGKSFRAGSTFRTWLYRILINTAKDTGAKSSRMQVFAKGGTGSSLPVSELPEHPDSQEQPDRARIRAAIETLSGDHRLLILLCYHQNLTHPQAAEVLDIPVGTLKSRLNTALTKLRAQLNEPEA